MHGVRREQPDAGEHEPDPPRPIEPHASAMAPVMTVAEARTMAIWKAADETS